MNAYTFTKATNAEDIYKACNSAVYNVLSNRLDETGKKVFADLLYSYRADMLLTIGTDEAERAEETIITESTIKAVCWHSMKSTAGRTKGILTRKIKAGNATEEDVSQWKFLHGSCEFLEENEQAELLKVNNSKKQLDRIRTHKSHFAFSDRQALLHSAVVAYLEYKYNPEILPTKRNLEKIKAIEEEENRSLTLEEITAICNNSARYRAMCKAIKATFADLANPQAELNQHSSFAMKDGKKVTLTAEEIKDFCVKNHCEVGEKVYKATTRNGFTVWQKVTEEGNVIYYRYELAHYIAIEDFEQDGKQIVAKSNNHGKSLYNECVSVDCMRFLDVADLASLHLPERDKTFIRDILHGFETIKKAWYAEECGHEEPTAEEYKSMIQKAMTYAKSKTGLSETAYRKFLQRLRERLSKAQTATEDSTRGKATADETENFVDSVVGGYCENIGDEIETSTPDKAEYIHTDHKHICNCFKCNADRRKAIQLKFSLD